MPLKGEVEGRLQATIVMNQHGDIARPGGMCGCCGSAPNVTPEWRGDPWYVYRVGICDSDGMYHSMLCEGSLEEIRASNARRLRTERDEIADQIPDLMGDDIDGAQAFIDDIQ